jgi:ubiquinone/menaquinone biosynthesis C-methylase UbiE
MKHEHVSKSTKRILDIKSIISNLEIKDGDVFVDAGCGDGYFSMIVGSHVGSHGKIYAIDNHEESINSLNSSIRDDSILNIIPILSDLKKVPIKKELVDIYYTSCVLHGFNEQDKIDVLNEAKRVLKTGGTLAIVEFVTKELPIGPSVDVKIGSNYLIKTLENLGFSFRKIITVGDYNYLIIFEKN